MTDTVLRDITIISVSMSFCSYLSVGNVFNHITNKYVIRQY